MLYQSVSVWVAKLMRKLLMDRKFTQGTKNMNRKGQVIMPHLAVLLTLAGMGSAQSAFSADGQSIANNTPKFVATAKKLGPANSAETIDVGIWLNPHNRAEMDTLAEELYNPASPSYHNWLAPADIVARFAPTAQEAQTVAEFLSSHNLPVVEIGPDNFFVHARGTIANVQKAFRVQINNFELRGQTYRANTTDPYVEGPAAALTSSVSGLDNLQYQHPVIAPASMKKPTSGGLQAATVNSDAEFFTSNCFTGVKTESYSGDNQDGEPASAKYKGNGYNGTNNIAGCGYTPQQIWTAYNLTGLYKEGYDGTGQSIAIIDWCGSPTIKADANTFSARFGLPPLTSSNFHIYNSSTPPTCGGPDGEINIDVEWAHAIAPGARINLVVPPSASFMDVDDAELYVLANGLGHVISGSYGSEELYTPLATLNEENLINQIAAVLGVSANFATGDYGDFTFDFPTTNPSNASVDAPADGPYATGVGGVTLALESDNKIKWQTGWGNNETLLQESAVIYDPPLNFGFYAGAGGGPSAVFSKPSFQHKLPGTQRLLPDISWLADPFTGGIIAITEPGVYPTEFEVYGGTSLATPMFSALWAIANQEHGTPLGQAARLLYSMPASTITDVLPVTSSTNVTGTITDIFGTTSYSADQLAAPLDGVTKFYSALWDVPLDQDTTVVLTFGTDTGLMTAPGWDDVTGLGTPNGKAFADYFKP
jgi:subtilase family serine protease